jgi:endonuclease/exonuclease/phosphatase family metal-dependent hydrolase
MTYNIRHGLGLDDQQSIERIRDVIASQTPEIVALQEVDNRVARSRWIDQATWLGEQLGMEVVFGQTLPLVIGSFGNAILSRYPIESWDFHPLPSLGELRGVLRAKVTTPKGNASFLCTHFGLDPEERLMQAGAMLEIARNAGRPTILMGDFNARPESRTIQLLSRPGIGLENLCPLETRTFPADDPNCRIDYIFATPGVKMVNYQAPATTASDHLPLVADLDF